MFKIIGMNFFIMILCHVLGSSRQSDRREYPCRAATFAFIFPLLEATLTCSGDKVSIFFFFDLSSNLSQFPTIGLQHAVEVIAAHCSPLVVSELLPDASAFLLATKASNSSQKPSGESEELKYAFPIGAYSKEKSYYFH